MHLGKFLGKLKNGKAFEHQPQELAILNQSAMGSMHRARKHYVLGLDIRNRNVNGDFVECGVYNGGSAATIALALRNTGRKIWLYDSFEGMPTPGALDGMEAMTAIGACVGSEEMVWKNLRIAGLNSNEVILRKGLFEETFQQPLPEKIAFLHIDADWYVNVLYCLDTLYDLVSEGGIILLDDFGHWEGCREAYYDFIQKRRVKPLLERTGHSAAFWIKGRTDNRQFEGAVEIPQISQGVKNRIGL